MEGAAVTGAPVVSLAVGAKLGSADGLRLGRADVADSVGASVGVAELGAAVGDRVVAAAVGESEGGADVGSSVLGCAVVEASVGSAVVAPDVGASVLVLGASVGACVGAVVAGAFAVPPSPDVDAGAGASPSCVKEAAAPALRRLAFETLFASLSFCLASSFVSFLP